MNASLYGAKLMRDLGAFDTAQVMDASEVDAPDLPVKNGGVLAVSQSGETKDVLRSVTQRFRTSTLGRWRLHDHRSVDASRRCVQKLSLIHI